MPRLRTFLPLTTLLLLSCGFDRPLVPSERVPVIQAALIAGADTQYFRLDWALDPDSGWDGLPRPIDPGDVDLVVTGDSGSQALIPAVWQGSAVFVVTLPILPNQVYSLSGTVAGNPIVASTRIPSQIQVIAPTADTVYIDADAVCLVYCEIDVQLDLATRATIINSLTSAGAVVLTVPFEAPYQQAVIANSPYVGAIEFIALGYELELYQLNDTPISNIEGGFGVFGGATKVRKGVVWE